MRIFALLERVAAKPKDGERKEHIEGDVSFDSVVLGSRISAPISFAIKARGTTVFLNASAPASAMSNVNAFVAPPPPTTPSSSSFPSFTAAPSGTAGTALSSQDGATAATTSYGNALAQALASNLMRASEPLIGRVRVDGVDVQAVSPSSLRKGIAIVDANPRVFTASLRDNITYGK